MEKYGYYKRPLEPQKTTVDEKLDPFLMTFGEEEEKPKTPAFDPMAFVRFIESKIQKISQNILGLESRVNKISSDSRDALAKVVQQLTERSQMDEKIEAMMTRHNQVVNNFEKQMSLMTKKIEDVQYQLIKSESTLSEAKKELARLKRF